MMSPNAPPLVSVVMPVWNGERYLAEAIDSILAQTYPHFELIVANDGSEDGTREMIDGYARKDPRVRPLHLPHRGLVPTLNDGCGAARGVYIARLDYDDIALPERLERQVEFLEEHPRVAVLGTGAQVITGSGKLTHVTASPPTEDIGRFLPQSNCLCHSTIMMRTETFLRLGGYRSTCAHAEDYDLWLRFADEQEIAGLHEVLVHYRIHAAQVSLEQLEQQALVSLAIRAAAQIRRSTGVDPLDGRDAIDRSTVRDLGISDDDIDTRLLGAYLNRLSMMMTLTKAHVALDALRDLVTRESLFTMLEFDRVDHEKHQAEASRSV